MGDRMPLQPAVPPHSTEAEQAVLGALLNDNAVLPSIAARLAGDDAWYHATHRMIWQACVHLIERHRPADVVTVCDLLVSREQADVVGGMPALNALAFAAVGSPRAYADIVAERAMARRTIAQAQRLIDLVRAKAASPGGAAAALDEALADLVALQQGATAGNDPRRVADLLPAWLDQLQARADGITDAMPTGMVDVDRILAGGLRPGELGVIGARPSMGKSALMLTIVRNVSALRSVRAERRRTPAT